MPPARRPAITATIVVVALVLLAAALIGCGNATPSTLPSVEPEPPTPTLVPTNPVPSGEPSVLQVTAENITFRPTTLEGPADVPFTIVLDNRDAGIPHGILLRAGPPVDGAVPNGRDLFAGEVVNGPSLTRNAIPALPAGVYTYSCVVHPNMVGTLTLR